MLTLQLMRILVSHFVVCSLQCFRGSSHPPQLTTIGVVGIGGHSQLEEG